MRNPAQKSLFRLGEQRHIDRPLPTAKHRAKSYHQKLMEVVKAGIAGTRVFKTLPKRFKFFQDILPDRDSLADW